METPPAFYYHESVRAQVFELKKRGAESLPPMILILLLGSASLLATSADALQRHCLATTYFFAVGATRGDLSPITP